MSVHTQAVAMTKSFVVWEAYLKSVAVHHQIKTSCSRNLSLLTSRLAAITLTVYSCQPAINLQRVSHTSYPSRVQLMKSDLSLVCHGISLYLDPICISKHFHRPFGGPQRQLQPESLLDARCAPLAEALETSKSVGHQGCEGCAANHKVESQHQSPHISEQVQHCFQKSLVPKRNQFCEQSEINYLRLQSKFLFCSGCFEKSK